jgi:anion-transporting  ArsA/GET3 family ATPase
MDPETRTPARLSLILGKGGVGRTTLACAFAVDRAAAGERVLLVSLTQGDPVASRIQHEAAGVDTSGRLELLALDPRQLVDDVVRKITRLGAMADYILRNPSYESLVDIVPGVREMALFHELGRRRELGLHDRIVLDAPATGHGMHLLEAPQKTARILAGPLRARAEELGAMLKDPRATDVILVTLAEETPVRETVQLAALLREEGFPLDNVVVNRWFPRVFVDERARRVLEAARDEPWAAPLRLVAAQRAEGEAHLAELRGIEGAKLAIVPLIPESARRLQRVAEAMKDFVPGAGAS